MTDQRHWTLSLSLSVAALEASGLAVYGFAILISNLTSGTSGASGSDVSPWVLFVSYLAFAALIGWIVRNLWRGLASARTPYLLTQAFALVVAQTLISGSEIFERTLGWLLVVLALGGAAALLSRPASRTLR